MIILKRFTSIREKLPDKLSTLKLLIKKLPQLKYTGGVSQMEIKKAQKQLGLTFSEDFIYYLLNFGQIEASGIKLLGISNKSLTSVVKVTLEERKRHSIPDGFYVIENLGIDGILYVQDSTGTVYEVSPGKKPKKFASSLLQYIQSTQKGTLFI